MHAPASFSKVSPPPPVEKGEASAVDCSSDTRTGDEKGLHPRSAVAVGRIVSSERMVASLRLTRTRNVKPGGQTVAEVTELLDGTSQAPQLTRHQNLLSMSDPLTPSEGQFQADVRLAWSYAINADLGPDPKAATDPAAQQRALQARADRHARYAQDLLHDLGADPDRLNTVAAACQAEHARRVADGHSAEGGYATAARLAKLALDTIRRAEADAGPAGRQRLIAELDQERAWSPGTYKQGLWHRHSWLRRLLRRGNPLWWYRRLHAALTETVTCGPYDGGSQYQQLTITMGGQGIGRLVFQICHQCRIGYVAKISVDQPYQDRGIATRALWAVRAEVPGYRWSTSGQELTARTFWQRIARRAGGYQTAKPCQHINPDRTTGNWDRGR